MQVEEQDTKSAEDTLEDLLSDSISSEIDVEEDSSKTQAVEGCKYYMVNAKKCERLQYLVDIQTEAGRHSFIGKQKRRFALFVDGFFRNKDIAIATDTHTASKSTSINSHLPSDLIPLLLAFSGWTQFDSRLSQEFKGANIQLSEDRLKATMGNASGECLRLEHAVVSGQRAVIEVTYGNGAIGESLGGCYFVGVVTRVIGETPAIWKGSPFHEVNDFEPFGVDDFENCFNCGGREIEEVHSEGRGIHKPVIKSKVPLLFVVDWIQSDKPLLAYAIPKTAGSKPDFQSVFVMELPLTTDAFYPIFCPYNGEATVQLNFL